MVAAGRTWPSTSRVHRADLAGVLDGGDVQPRAHHVVERRAGLFQRGGDDDEAAARLGARAFRAGLARGTTGPVPDTSTRPAPPAVDSTRTARLNPMAGSNGEPDEMRCVMPMGRCWHLRHPLRTPQPQSAPSRAVGTIGAA